MEQQNRIDEILEQVQASGARNTESTAGIDSCYAKCESIEQELQANSQDIMRLEGEINELQRSRSITSIKEEIAEWLRSLSFVTIESDIAEWQRYVDICIAKCESISRSLRA